MLNQELDQLWHLLLFNKYKYIIHPLKSLEFFLIQFIIEDLPTFVKPTIRNIDPAVLNLDGHVFIIVGINLFILIFCFTDINKLLMFILE